MCLIGLPGLPRVRHWSCPERLPSLCTEALQLPLRARDAESLPRTPGLALWEEKVLSLRGTRVNKHRELLGQRALREQEEEQEEERWDLQEEAVREEETVSMEQLQERLLRAFLGPAGGGPGEDSPPGEGAPPPHPDPEEAAEVADPPPPPPLPSPPAGKASSGPHPVAPPIPRLRPSEARPPPSSLSPPRLLGPSSSYSSLAALASWLCTLAALWPRRRAAPSRCRGPRPAARERPWRARPSRPPWLLLASFCLLSLPAPALAQMELEDSEHVCVDGVYRGNIDINNRDEESKMSILAKYVNCSVVEGSISITSAVYSNDDTNYSMPNLVEVTDFVLLYRADEIISFKDIFPRLAVIRGHKLVQYYALAIYQNAKMENVGLPSLTHIMNGGVRIEKNPSLCYVDTVDWNKIVQRKHDLKNIYLHDNQNPNVCPAKCPEKCSGTEFRCWNGDQCQRMLGICPKGTKFKNLLDRCYVNNEGQVGIPCAKECIGGCTEVNNGDSCFACNHTRHMADPAMRGAFTCRELCPAGFVAYKKWTCIEESECSTREILSPVDHFSSVNGDNNYKVEDKQCVVKCDPKNKAEKGRDDNIWRCQPCQDKCPVICMGTVVNTPQTAKKLASCTDIIGDIVISVIDAEITSVLEENLQHIESIQGSLKIERSHSLVSLHFFKSLRKIKGQGVGREGSAEKVLTIFENDNLQKLFPDNKKVKLGGPDKDGYTVSPVVFIHYNQKLCQKEIAQFLDSSDVPSDLRSDHMISPFSNGNKIVCSEEKLHIQVNPGGPMFLQVNYQNYQHRLETSNNNVDINALLGYHVYYRELTEQQFEEQNMSKFEGMDVCGGSRWQIHFEEHNSKNTYTRTNLSLGCDEKTERCMLDNGKLWAVFIYPDITTYIINRKPYTPYAVYVTTVMEKSLAANATGAQSDIIYTRTLESKPTQVVGVMATSETNATTTSLTVEWQPPSDPNGVIEQYYVVVAYLELGRDVADRDYCSDKAEDKEKEEQPLVKKPKEKPIMYDNMTMTCPAMDCQSCSAEPDQPAQPNGGTAPTSNTVQGEQAFYNEIINKLFQIQTTASFEDGGENPGIVISQRRRRDISSSSPLNSVPGPTEPPGPEPVLVQQNPQGHLDRDHPPRQIATDTRYMTVAGKEYINRTFMMVPGNKTRASISQLIHFGNFEVRVFACQKLQNYTEGGQYRVCSDETILNTRTMHRAGADDIKPFNSKAEESLHTVTNNSVLALSWRKPESPNGMVLNYVLAFSLRDDDWSERCLSLSKILQKDKFMEYNLEQPGDYWIRLRAISLYDEGEWTTKQRVYVASDRSGTIITVIVLCFLALVAAMAGAYGYVQYKRKKDTTSGNWAYSTRNPDYVETADVYVADSWECDRDDVDLGEELGKGSFGMVYKGVFKNPKKGGAVVHCAVKTVNEQAGLKQRIEFLREASAMKECNTEHVIKLIAVVSQSQPVLVLMELMENGDLKEYLRKHRPDDQNNRDGHLQIPTLAQVLQMAADIADGMAYLGNKKIVHRDLAARNCMLSADTVVKVGDFGMARDVYETEYYRKEGRGFLPVRWMAPESIRDGKFTSQSDVWSYGVVLWEMATLAEVPYQGLANEQVMSYVKEGRKMQRPENCPDVLFEMMSECWEAQPNSRPTFLDLCRKLDSDASEGFHQNAFYLSNEGQEAVLNQEQMQQMRREQEEAAASDPQTPLTAQGNGSNGLSPENGHLPASGDSHQMVVIRPGTSRSPTHVQFSNEQPQLQPSSRTSKLSMNGIIGEFQRLRNKSGSTSGEA